jgi:lysyl-tRNA synthetase class 2
MNYYPHTYEINTTYDNLINISREYANHYIDDKIYKIQCRVILKRSASKNLHFMTVNILNGENLVKSDFQIVIARQLVGEIENMELVKEITLGDVIGVDGNLGKTKIGEPSIFVKSFKILSKCKNELPKEHFGISDIDVRFRQRYLDLIINEKSRYNIITRSKVIKEIRNIMENENYMEVETPVLHTNYGGANAMPFITKINAYNMNMYMRISPELFLKQLIIGGLNKIYEIGKQFRNEGADTTHNPEFTSIECYHTPADYNDMKRLCKKIIQDVIYKIKNSYKIRYNDIEIDFSDFREVDYLDELRRKLNYDFKNLESEETYKEVSKILEDRKIRCEEPRTIGRMLDKLAGEYIEKECIQPTFVLHHPRIISPLAKYHREDEEKTERFELFINGKEYANAYTELNIPEIQEKAFREQSKDKNKGDTEAQPTDMDFVRALEYGLPPTGGLGIGIDRLVMLVCNEVNIREILTYPIMK